MTIFPRRKAQARRDLNARISRIEAVIEAMPQKIGAAVGDAINKAARGGERR